MHEFELITSLAGCLVAALLGGYVTQRLGLSPIVGYLLAGVIVGPSTPGFVADRHDKLIDLIRAGAYSSRDLAEKLGVSEQTIYRDIDFLKQRGYSIRSEKHAHCWAYHLVAEPQ